MPVQITPVPSARGRALSNAAIVVIMMGHAERAGKWPPAPACLAFRIKGEIYHHDGVFLDYAYQQ
jgi:hypothetical protein